jgi:hypothetical protein
MKKRRCVPLFSLLFLIALLIGLYFVPAVVSQKSGTERTKEYNDDGQLVNVERIHDNDLLVEKKEFDIKTGKLRRRITYKYLKGFKQADTSTTNYQPDGKTPQSNTNVDHDKDGNTTSTSTTNYDETGKETGGSKRERDPKTGKERCYNWNPSKQVYEEVECPKKPWVSSVGDNAKVETGGGLIKVNFNVEGGRVIVNLPDDMRAGDTISGTVFEEPKGQSEDERNRNEKTLNGLVVNFAGERVLVSAKTFKLSIPTAVAGNPKPSDFRIIIEPRAPQDPPVRFFQGPQDDPFFFDIPAELFYRPAPQPPQQFAIPSLGQTGRPIVITGPFDGDSSNTKIDFQASGPNVTPIGGDLNGMVPIAESPRKVIVQSPSDVTGPMEIRVKEGMTETKGTFRNLGVKLSAPKTSLLRGERTTLTIEVNGLQGIPKPVPLTLESNGVITMEGGMYQPLVIQPSQVGADGRYTMARGITGVQAGGWSTTVTVVTQPFNIVLRDPDPPQTVLINSFTGDYVFCGLNVKLRGTGEIKLNGNALTLTDNKPDRQVQGVYRFESTRQLYFPVESLRSPGTTVNIQSTVTESKPPRTRVYFNPLSRPAPPVQDVSAFATCP